MLIHLLIWVRIWAKMGNAVNSPEPKVKILLTTNICDMFKLLIIFYSQLAYFKSTIVLEHV